MPYLNLEYQHQKTVLKKDDEGNEYSCVVVGNGHTELTDVMFHLEMDSPCDPPLEFRYDANIDIWLIMLNEDDYIGWLATNSEGDVDYIFWDSNTYSYIERCIDSLVDINELKGNPFFRINHKVDSPSRKLAMLLKQAAYGYNLCLIEDSIQEYGFDRFEEPHIEKESARSMMELIKYKGFSPLFKKSNKGVRLTKGNLIRIVNERGVNSAFGVDGIFDNPIGLAGYLVFDGDGLIGGESEYDESNGVFVNRIRIDAPIVVSEDNPESMRVIEDLILERVDGRLRFAPTFSTHGGSNMCRININDRCIGSLFYSERFTTHAFIPQQSDLRYLIAMSRTIMCQANHSTSDYPHLEMDLLDPIVALTQLLNHLIDVVPFDDDLITTAAIPYDGELVELLRTSASFASSVAKAYKERHPKEIDAIHEITSNANFLPVLDYSIIHGLQPKDAAEFIYAIRIYGEISEEKFEMNYS